MRGIVLLALLALTGCAEPARVIVGLSGVVRDGRGDPILPPPVAAPDAERTVAAAKPESCAHRRRCP